MSDGTEFGPTRYPVYQPDNLSVFETDYDSDGTTDLQVEYFYEPDDGTASTPRKLLRERVSEDTDQDGTFDLVVHRYFDGTGRNPSYAAYDDWGADGYADGTADWMEFRGGVDYSHTIDGAQPGLAGVWEIELASRGTTTLTISNSDLFEFAGDDESYELYVYGQSDDVVRFADDGIIATGGTEDGYVVYHGARSLPQYSTILKNNQIFPFLRFERSLWGLQLQNRSRSGCCRIGQNLNTDAGS